MWGCCAPPRRPARQDEGTSVVLSEDDLSLDLLSDDHWKKLCRAQTVTLTKPGFSTPCRGDDVGQERLRTLIKCLLLYDQQHLFSAEWESAASKDKEAFLDQIAQKSALEHAVRFRKTVQAETKIEDIEPVKDSDIVRLSFCSREHTDYEAKGKEVLLRGKAGFILVAGGLGERLGASQIKISLPVESLTKRSFLDLFLCHLQTFRSSETSRIPPLFIMTSDDTHEPTKELLSSLNMAYSEDDPSGDVFLAKQETVASFMDTKGRFAMKTPTTLLLKPHGHGDVHPLFRSKCLEEWIQRRGIEYAAFFQDTNPNCFRVLPVLLGVAENMSLDCAIACVPRVPKSATGCIARHSGRNTIENFEYNLMNAVFAKQPELDPLYFVGNTNQFVVRLSAYANVPADMPEFCNPKYASGSKTDFTSPARLECMMQDVMRFFPGEKTRVVLFEDDPEHKAHSKTHCLYAPAKNSAAAARKAWDQGTVDGSAASSEACVYSCVCLLLRAIGCNVQSEGKYHFGPENVMFVDPLYPSIVMDPSVLPFFSDASFVFPAPSEVSIGHNASLEVHGPGKVVIKRLQLEGSLIIRAASPKTTIVIDGVVVRNDGRRVESQDGDARFKISHADNCRVIESDAEGDVIVSE